MESLNGERTLDPKMAIREVLTNLKEVLTGGGKRMLIEVQCKNGPVMDLNKFEGDLKIIEADAQYPLIQLDIK